MTLDPDEQPTRYGGPPPSGPPAKRPDDPTVPAFDAKGKKGGAPGAARSVNAGNGAPAAVSNDPLVGKELGGCRLERLLGRGAMGAVYKARQVKLDRDVAVKIIRPEMMTDQRMLKRFEVEARTVGKFNSANVVMVHDVGFELGLHWLVMEFVQGKNLRDHVKLLAGGRLPAGEALPLLRQAIKGLEEAQRLKVVHRDIKPDNLMLTDRGMLKIADFGIAKPLQEDFSMTLTSELVGTPLYMSPEQCHGQAELDFRSDMYSLGATFYYLLTGEPPIRASSVYELIQTKTKLANLCLWKALPGLEENNPLSRVIERMTALDREDRYGSYEELLNDLVLVEQGQTITVPKRTGGTGIRKRLAGKGARSRAAWLAIVLLLAAGGGGFAWYASRPGPVDPVPGPAGSDAGVAAAEQMKSLRARLAENGPSASLQADAKKIAPTKEQEKERDTLITDIGTGLALKKKLDGIKQPARLVPPFDDLRKHFDAVTAAAPLDTPVMAELTEWRKQQVAKARNEQELTAVATAALTSDFTKWTSDRGKAGNDAAKLASLRQRLQVIDDGRRALITMVPSAFEQLNGVLPQDALDQARLRLDQTNEAPDDVDVTEILAAARTQFPEEGPTESLRNQIDKLKPTRSEQIAARGQLLDDIDSAKTVRDDAFRIRNSLFPSAPVPPFTEVTDYYKALDRAFAELRAADGKLPPWADRLRSDYRAEKSLQASVLEACRSAYGRWQERQRQGASSAELATGLAALRAAMDAAVKLFPALAPELEGAIPAATLIAAETSLARAGQREKWLGDAAAWEKGLADVRTLVDWKRDGARLARELEALKTAAAPLGADADAVRLIQRADETTGRWNTAMTKVDAAGKQLADGNLTTAAQTARTGVSGAEGKTEVTALADAIAACAEAFTAIKNKLDVREAKTLLANANTRVEPIAALVPGVAERIARWTSGIEKFERATAGMVVIPAGRPKGGAPLSAFLMSPTECSRADFAQFLTELRAAAGNGDPQQQLAAVAPRLEGAGITTERLRGLLNLDVKADKLPIDRVTWYSAAAFAAWYGRALPTQEEWLLAALGEDGRFPFPFGTEWSNDSQKRNPSDERLVDVDSGGLSWRSADGLRIHHLAGNVAEWLAADPAARDAKVAGGRFNDKTTSAKEQAGGKAPPFDKSDGQRGFGFRTVLRPTSFRELEFPRN